MKKLLFLLAVMLIAVGMSMAQTAATGSSSSDQNSAASSSNNAGQNSSATTPSSTTTDQNATSTSGNTADQNAAADSNASSSSSNKGSGKLPQTGSELPLLAMLGLGTLGTGVFQRFRK